MTITIAEVPTPETQPTGVPRVAFTRSLAGRRQDVIDEFRALAEQVSGDHPLFDDIAEIVRLRTALGAKEFAFWAKLEALSRGPQ